MDEYASKRFTLFCTRAPTFPRVIDSAAATQISQKLPGALMEKTRRKSTANVAALGAVDMKPTTGAGAPSYTSGVQIWKGAAATLNPRPTNIRAMATYTSNTTGPASSFRLIWSMLVNPVAPNMSATPYRKNAVANDPRRKYLSEASLLDASLRRNPVRIYVEMEEISSAMKIRTNSTAEDISAMPTAPKRISA